MGNVNIKEIRTEDDEIEDIIERTLCYTPEERLRNLGEMRDFIYTHMTPEGKKYFERSREAGYPINISERGLSNLEISEIESKIRSEVVALSNEELTKLYQLTLQGAKAHIGSIKRCRNTNSVKVIHYATYTYALDTCRFAKDAIKKGVRELKVKKDCRHSEYVDTIQVLSDAIRRVTVLEEYIRRN